MQLRHGAVEGLAPRLQHALEEVLLLLRPSHRIPGLLALELIHHLDGTGPILKGRPEPVRAALEKGKVPTVEAKLGMIPGTYVKVDEQKSKSMMRLLEALDDHDDVQNVFSNFDVPEEMMDEE